MSEHSTETQDIGGVQFPAKTIRVLPFDMLRIASGHPMAFEASDGERVTIMLFTAEEFLAEQHRVADGDGFKVSPQRAKELTQPLSILT